ncbi:MAG: hypothetical protein QN650_10980, partial [Nitrososphaeraceae archaeon]|nr:hypothetical protein [Nitrososphaeraceae archaeon]
IHGELKGEIFESVYDGMKFAVYHGTNIAKKEQLIKSGKYDVFIYGHTHRKDNRYIGLQELSIQARLRDGFLDFSRL